jgi:phosphoribosylformylglycinamidine synthase subunit PurS
VLGQEAQSRTLRPVVKIVVDVMLKPEIHDPQGEAIVGACHRLGFGDVVSVRQGKRFEVEFTEPGETGAGGTEPAGTGTQAAESVTADAAAARVAQIAAELLANPVIEEFAVRAG